MTVHQDYPELNERARHLLKVLVEGYIQDGQPLGSRTLARQSGLDLSAATIRNVMADLEAMGCICAPHKSAGRVPTSLGYRLFVNSMVSVKTVDQPLVQSLQTQLEIHQSDHQSLIQSASSLLSGVTQLAGIVTIPKRNQQIIRHIDFVRLSQQRILVVLVMEHDDVQNRIIHTERDISASELQQASNYLNELLVGKDMQQARSFLLNAMDKDRAAMNEIMLAAIKLGEQAMGSDADAVSDGEGCVIAGESNLMDYDDLSDISTLRQLFTAFNQKRDVLSLLDKCMNADGIQVFIGSESGYDAFGDCSVVTAPYAVDGQQLGVLGVIGPKRIPYNSVIPTVDVTAKLLSAALKVDQ